VAPRRVAGQGAAKFSSGVSDNDGVALLGATSGALLQLGRQQAMRFEASLGLCIRLTAWMSPL